MTFVAEATILKATRRYRQAADGDAKTLFPILRKQQAAYFAGLGDYLAPAAPVCIYGPFNYAGAYTSDSNARFDARLKQRDPQSGIKHFENIVELASQVGLALLADQAMPANNRLLVFEKVG